MLNKKLPKKKKKGFALTEVLLSVAVIVIIGIAAYPLYQNSRTSSTVEQMANEITQISTNLQKVNNGQGNYNGASLDVLKNTGLLPDTLKISVVDTGIRQ